MFYNVEDIVNAWGLDKTQPYVKVVFDELAKIKGPPLQPHPSGLRELGFKGKAFSKATQVREEFYHPKPEKPEPATADGFEKILKEAQSKGFKNLVQIGYRWGMTWYQVLSHLPLLDPVVRDVVKLVPDGLPSLDIPLELRAGLYQGEFDRLTVLKLARDKRLKDDQDKRNVDSDAYVIRLRAEKARKIQEKQERFEEWDNRLKAAKAKIDAQWTVYNDAVQKSRDVRGAKLLKAEDEFSTAVDPLQEKLKADVVALGDEPEDGPRFSAQSEIWWTYQHTRNRLKLDFSSTAGQFFTKRRETIANAKDEHRSRVLQLRKELRVALRPLKRAGYKIFKEGPKA